MEESVYLRALELSDLEKINKWHNDECLYKGLEGSFHFISTTVDEAWLKSKCTFLKDEVNLAICLKDTNEHIGNIYLRNIDWISRTATLSIFIGETEHRGNGYGTSSMRQLISYAFDELNLRKICLAVLADNKVAQHLYEKIGFTIEGTLERQVFKSGQLKDVVCMALFRELSG